MAVAKGKGTRSKSVLGGNWRGTHRQLYQTLLGAPAKSGVLEKGEGCCLTCDHLPRRHGCAYAHTRRLGPIRMAAQCGCTTDRHTGRAVWLGPQKRIDLSAVMPVTEFRVTDEEGTYLCTAHGLVFEGSILAYDPVRDKVEWVPAHEVANDLSWVEERMVVVLANFVPCAGQEVDRIAELGTCHLLA